MLFLFGAGVRASPQFGRPNQSGVLPKGTGRIDRLFRSLPVFFALGQFVVGEIDRQLASCRIDGDDVAVYQSGNGATVGTFRPDMADAEAPRRARETTVGDKSNFFAHALTGKRGGGGQHFAHAGAACGPFIADHQHFALFIGAGLNGLEGLFFAFKHAGRADEALVLGRDARDFDDRAFGCKVAFQADNAACGSDRGFDLEDDFAIRFPGDAV